MGARVWETQQRSTSRRLHTPLHKRYFQSCALEPLVSGCLVLIPSRQRNTERERQPDPARHSSPPPSREVGEGAWGDGAPGAATAPPRPWRSRPCHVPAGAGARRRGGEAPAVCAGAPPTRRLQRGPCASRRASARGWPSPPSPSTMRSLPGPGPLHRPRHGLRLALASSPLPRLAFASPRP